MPYIKKLRRPTLDAGTLPDNPGELNYIITTVCIDYMNRWGKNYQIINDVVGALECAKQEFYRRAAAPYEDTKITDNGDVYV